MYHSNAQPDLGVVAFQGSGTQQVLLSNLGSGNLRVTVAKSGAQASAVSLPTTTVTITAFGTYTVNEADHSISEHIIGSSFPIWDNTNQKRSITITGDEMKYINPTPATGGGTAVVILKRAE